MIEEVPSRNNSARRNVYEKNRFFAPEFDWPSLIRLTKKDDSASLEYIHLRYKRLFFWFGKQMLENYFVVETFVHDTFLKLWLHRDSIETPNHIIGFLRFVLKRNCITYFNAPKNKFTRLIDSLERFENY